MLKSLKKFIVCMSLGVLSICAFWTLVPCFGMNTQATQSPGIFTFSEDELYIFAYNTGQANFIILRYMNDLYVVDAGYKHGYNNLNKFHYLKDVVKGATLKHIFITHCHDDHYSLLQPFINTYFNKRNDVPIILGGDTNSVNKLESCSNTIKYVYCSGHDARPLESNTYYSPIISTNIFGNAQNNGWSKIPLKINSGKLNFTLYPPCVKFNSSNPNTASYALSVEFGNKKILFCGDYILGDSQLTFGLEASLQNKCDIAFLPHHGSNNTDSKEFINLGNDQCLFFICGGGENLTTKNDDIFYYGKQFSGTVSRHEISIKSGIGPQYAATTRPIYTTSDAINDCYIIKVPKDNSKINVANIKTATEKTDESLTENSGIEKSTILLGDSSDITSKYDVSRTPDEFMAPWIDSSTGNSNVRQETGNNPMELEEENDSGLSAVNVSKEIRIFPSRSSQVKKAVSANQMEKKPQKDSQTSPIKKNLLSPIKKGQIHQSLRKGLPQWKEATPVNQTAISEENELDISAIPPLIDGEGPLTGGGSEAGENQGGTHMEEELPKKDVSENTGNKDEFRMEEETQK